MKLAASIILIVTLLTPVWSQDDIPIPPKKQNTYYFTIQKFNRQPAPPQYLKEKINSFSKKPKSKWTLQDSLFYAYEKVHLEEFAFALSIFSKLDMDTVQEPHAQQLYRTALLQTKRYDDLLAFNARTLKEDTTSVYSIRDVVLQLSKTYLAKSEGSFTLGKDTLFPFLYSDTMDILKSSRQSFRTDMVEIAKNVDTALRYFTFLHDRRDAVLSQAYEEFGDFQRSYFYISNAYLCYAIARHYNRNNRDLANKYNRAIDEIAERNYLLPSFRTKFGKVIDNRYQLSEKLTELKKDTVDPKENFKPPEILKKEDYIPWLDVPIAIMAGLFLVLLGVLLFLRSDKSNN